MMKKVIPCLWPICTYWYVGFLVKLSLLAITMVNMIRRMSTIIKVIPMLCTIVCFYGRLVPV
jgi:hypothetical protein